MTGGVGRILVCCLLTGYRGILPQQLMSVPKTPYIQLVIPRIAAAIPRLEKRIWKIDPDPLPVAMTAPCSAHKNYGGFDWNAAERIQSYPYFWGRIYDQAWFRIAVSRESLLERQFLFWKDQAEATLYVDGHPWSGFDVAHRHALLPAHFQELSVEAICCQSAIWHPDATGIDSPGSRFEGAFLGTRDEAAWKLYHDFKVLFDLAIYLCRRDGYDPEDLVKSERYRKPLERLSPQARRIFTELDRLVDYFESGRIDVVDERLVHLYEVLRSEISSMRITLTGHAHIDLVWLWPEAVGEAKAVHTFATVNRLMDHYPEFYFAYSQPASYEAVARRSPALMAEVERRIADGRWEPTGALYVESDTQLPCGEALLRSFTVGQEAFEKLTGKPSKVVWLPDVFGYSACLPQLMRATGAEYFFTTKQAWSNSTRFPFSSFRWRGQDGTEVIAHVLHSLLANGYNTTTMIEEMVEPALSHQQSGLHPEALIPVGYGDGGGGPTEEMCERVQRIRALDGVPPPEWGRVDRFFERMEPIRESLPVWHGEIYLEYHRGVQTTHVRLKQDFRGLERALQTLEATHALHGEGPIPERFWKRLIFAQFHDYIPGSSVHEVYAEALPELRSLAEEALQGVENFGQGSRSAWFNPLPYVIDHVFEEEGVGRQIRLPPLSKTVLEESVGLKFKPVEATETLLQNERVQATFNADGEIGGLRIDDYPIAIKNSLNQLFVYPDHPVMFEAWDIDRQCPANPVKPVGVCGAAQVEKSATEASLRFCIRLTKKSTADICYMLRVGEPFLRIVYKIDWQDTETLLQAHFPTAYIGHSARFGAPFGSTKRPQMASNAAADAQFEVPASRWAVVSDDNERDALALISKDRYGFGCRDGLLHVSLLRSALITDAVRNRDLRQREYPHDYSDLGQHRFELLIAAGGADAPRFEQAAALADIAYSAPILCRCGESMSAGLVGITGGDTLIPSWVKPIDGGNGYILRLHETRGYGGEVMFEVAPGWKVEHCDVSELSASPLLGNCLTFKPYSIESVRFSHMTL